VDDYEWCVNFKSDRTSFDEITLPFFKKLFGRVLSLQDDMDAIIESLVAYRDTHGDIL